MSFALLLGLADSGEDVVTKPPVAEGVQVQVPPVVTPVQDEDTAMAEGALHRFMEENDPSLPLLLLVFDSKLERVLVSRTRETEADELGQDLLARRIVVELHVLERALHEGMLLDREPLVRNGVVRPVVLGCLDQCRGLLPRRRDREGWAQRGRLFRLRLLRPVKRGGEKLGKRVAVLDPALHTLGVEITGQVSDNGGSEFGELVGRESRGSTTLSHGVPPVCGLSLSPTPCESFKKKPVSYTA